jgi:hypothetical protein
MEVLILVGHCVPWANPDHQRHATARDPKIKTPHVPQSTAFLAGHVGPDTRATTLPDFAQGVPVVPFLQ